MDIRIKIYCVAENGDDCEAYGSLHFNIGNRPENQNIEIWRHERENYVTTIKYIEYHIDIERMFQETNAFTLSNTDMVTFTGEFKEQDTGIPDDLLATISGKPNAFVRANEIYNTYKTERFSEGNNYIDIMIRFTFA